MHRAEYRAESARGCVVDLATSDVARQQVWRALDALELRFDGVSKSAGRCRLREPRNRLEKDVSTRDDRGQEAETQSLLTHDFCRIGRRNGRQHSAGVRHLG